MIGRLQEPDACEACGRPIAAGEAVRGIPIGGGWAFECMDCTLKASIKMAGLLFPSHLAAESERTRRMLESTPRPPAAETARRVEYLTGWKRRMERRA